MIRAIAVFGTALATQALLKHDMVATLISNHIPMVIPPCFLNRRNQPVLDDVFQALYAFTRFLQVYMSHAGIGTYNTIYQVVWVHSLIQ